VAFAQSPGEKVGALQGLGAIKTCAQAFYYMFLVLERCVFIFCFIPEASAPRGLGPRWEQTADIDSVALRNIKHRIGFAS
jgi:hypothetical protein